MFKFILRGKALQQARNQVRDWASRLAEAEDENRFLELHQSSVCGLRHAVFEAIAISRTPAQLQIRAAFEQYRWQPRVRLRHIDGEPWPGRDIILLKMAKLEESLT